MLILGLTGSIGMGKSTTAKLFIEAGVPVYDADAAVHQLYEGEAAPVIEAAFPGTTANGKVASSGWMGGYGRMVEIDHGNGLSTRYGHLSEIHVRVGDVVRIGQVIGAVGSTGRSTGPHLHYETRIDGDAVDPQKFLRAGVRLSSG